MYSAAEASVANTGSGRQAACYVGDMKVSRFAGIAVCIAVCIGVCIGVSGVAAAQTMTRDKVIDRHPSYGEPLEKVVDFFASATFPSVVVGGRVGMYLYRSTTDTLAGPWTRSTLTPSGNSYERARAIRFPGDAYPGVVASIGNQIIWFENPRNRDPGADITLPWRQHVINPDHGCHDIQLVDLDGDGRIDVVCSAGISLGAPQFVAFQDDRDHWQLVYDVVDAGDAIAVVRIGSDATPNLVADDHSGHLNWYENPRLKGTGARTSNWVRHYIGPGNLGNSLGVGPVASARDDVMTAANEDEGPGGSVDERGLTWYEQPANPDEPWIAHPVAADFRDIHEINIGRWRGNTPYFLVAEQEQACKPARPEGRPPSHPRTSCRIAMFQWTHGKLRKTILARTSTHNQSVIPWRDGLLMADANHGVYGASKAIHLRVIKP